MQTKETIALVTSVNMDDYLEFTIEKNRGFFERYYVLGAKKDEISRKICNKFSAEFIEYENFFPKGCAFNKSGGIRHAQEMLHAAHQDKWIILLDTDILLPPQIVDLDTSLFDKEALYGIDRFDAYTMKDLSEKKTNLYSNRYPKQFVGYFQMYYDKSKKYPPRSHSAEGCDGTFKLMFEKKIKIQKMNVVHIGKERSHWFGRSRYRLEDYFFR